MRIQSVFLPGLVIAGSFIAACSQANSPTSTPAIIQEVPANDVIVGQVSDASGTFSMRGGITIQQQPGGSTAYFSFVSPLRSGDPAPFGVGGYNLSNLGAWLAGSPLRVLQTLDQHYQVSYPARNGQHVFRPIVDARISRMANGTFALDLDLGPAFAAGHVAVADLAQSASAHLQGQLSVACAVLSSDSAQSLSDGGDVAVISAFRLVADPGARTAFCRDALTSAGLSDLIQ